ncbi:MAG: 30S ribosomal protein S2, partial [Proteobacteria bacterium]|nr:30S ribosomal protein S2 [Pseudomonadota bacterium]
IHIIDVEKSLQYLEKAYEFMRDEVAEGKTVLMVGTKRQAKDIIKESAERAGAYYVTERWLGGMLTNFRTIKKTVARMIDYEKMEEDGRMSEITKKEALKIRKERMKLNKYLNGIRDMNRIPDIMFIIDIKNEEIAFKEALKLGIPVVAIADTNIDPDDVAYPIPGNDDATKSIKLFTTVIAAAIEEGKEMREKKLESGVEEKMIEERKAEEDKANKEKAAKAAEHSKKTTIHKTAEKKAPVKKIKEEPKKETKKTTKEVNKEPKSEKKATEKKQTVKKTAKKTTDKTEKTEKKATEKKTAEKKTKKAAAKKTE